MSQPTKAPAEQAANKPSKDDVHEQRQDGQTAEGVKQAPRSQSQDDEARAEGEGMTRPQSVPDPSEANPGGQPTPGANSLAGRQG